MKKRPLWLNRSPSLHRHSILAFEPVLRARTLYLRSTRSSPKGLNADFDGDQMAVHVPVSQEAIDEMKGKKPSDLLFSAGQDELMLMPGQSSGLGLFLMSRGHKYGKPKGIYPDKDAALKAHQEGRITLEDPIRVAGELTTAGRIKIDEFLPPKQRGGLRRPRQEGAVAGVE